MISQQGTAISTNFRVNHQIRISPIRLISATEEQVGIVSTSDALRMALEAGLDLVEVAPNARPPVCRIMDYGKWRYMQQKKEDKSRASSRAGQLKEVKIKTVRIGEHDLEIKINHAREFLEEGNKVQFTLQFKGREMAHIDLGRNIFVKIKQELLPVSKVERDAKMEGRRMTMVLQPEHKTAKTSQGGGANSGGGQSAGGQSGAGQSGGGSQSGGDRAASGAPSGGAAGGVGAPRPAARPAAAGGLRSAAAPASGSSLNLPPRPAPQEAAT